MRLKTLNAALAAAALPPLLLLLGCDAKGVKETRTAAALALKDVQALVDEATEKGIKERERNRSEEPLEWPAVAATAIMQFQASPDARAIANPYDAGKPVFVAKPEGREPGTVYLDATPAASGAILVVAVFKEGSSVKREAKSVNVPIATRPKKIDVDSGGPPVAPSF